MAETQYTYPNIEWHPLLPFLADALFLTRLPAIP